MRAAVISKRHQVDVVTNSPGWSWPPDPDVRELAAGQRVAVDPSLYCHECQYCRIGRNNLCERWKAIGVSVPGGAAQFTVAPVANCVPLPDSIQTG
jgi:threonine dehydrogenase-like Zn-dependent dehydrogenase